MITIKKGSEAFAQIEELLTKIATANNVDNVEQVSIYLTPESGVLTFRLATDYNEFKEKVDFSKQSPDATPQEMKQLRIDISTEMNKLSQDRLRADATGRIEIDKNLKQLDDLRKLTFNSPEEALKLSKELMGLGGPSDPNYKPLSVRDVNPKEEGAPRSPWGYEDKDRWVSGPAEENAARKSLPEPTQFDTNEFKDVVVTHVPEGRKTYTYKGEYNSMKKTATNWGALITEIPIDWLKQNFRTTVDTTQGEQIDAGDAQIGDQIVIGSPNPMDDSFITVTVVAPNPILAQKLEQIWAQAMAEGEAEAQKFSEDVTTMKINSNTVLVKSGSAEYKKLEEVIQKIAEENKFENVKSIAISLAKDSGTIKFAFEEGEAEVEEIPEVPALEPEIGIEPEMGGILEATMPEEVGEGKEVEVEIGTVNNLNIS